MNTVPRRVQDAKETELVVDYVFLGDQELIEVNLVQSGTAKFTNHPYGGVAYIDMPYSGKWLVCNEDNASVAIRYIGGDPNIYHNDWAPFLRTKENLKLCSHQFVEMGFMHSKLVCKFCDLEKT